MTENLRIALIQQRAAGRSCGTFWENRLFCAGDTQEGIFCVDLDMQALRTWRQENVWGEKYRRPRAYHRLSGASSLR